MFRERIFITLLHPQILRLITFHHSIWAHEFYMLYQKCHSPRGRYVQSTRDGQELLLFAAVLFSLFSPLTLSFTSQDFCVVQSPFRVWLQLFICGRGYIPLNHTPFFLLHASCGVKADRCICHRMPQTSIRPQYRIHGCRRMHQRLARLSDSFAILDHTFSTTSSNSRIRFFASSSSLP